MSSRYIIDKDDFRIRKVRPNAARILRRVLKYFLVSISLAVVYYMIFALIFSTDTERKLKQENRQTLKDAVDMCLAAGDSLPPLVLPLKDFPYAQTGASAGMKMSPFYKVYHKHKGLDLIVPSGTPVYAPADGKVVLVRRSGRESGNVLVLDHGNGYSTGYAHLKEILVRDGRMVKKGDQIATTGSSGKSFAPHLHYEVIKDTLPQDPVNYFFGSVTPEEYMEMMILGESIAQSME